MLVHALERAHVASAPLLLVQLHVRLVVCRHGTETHSGMSDAQGGMHQQADTHAHALSIFKQL
jgi:hypothetical protein